MQLSNTVGRTCNATYPRQTPPKFLRQLENDAANTMRRIRKLENAGSSFTETHPGEEYRYMDKIFDLKRHLRGIITNINDTRSKLMPSNPNMRLRRMVCNKGIKKHMPLQGE